MAVAVPVGSRCGCSTGMRRAFLGAPCLTHTVAHLFRCPLWAAAALAGKGRAPGRHVAECSGSIWRYAQQRGEQGSGVLVQRMSVRLSGPVCGWSSGAMWV